MDGMLVIDGPIRHLRSRGVPVSMAVETNNVVSMGAHDREIVDCLRKI